MRLAAVLALGSLFAALQEPPKLTLERSDSVQVLAKEVATFFSEKVVVHPDVLDKKVSLKIRDSGFLEALDALCRAHGDMTYREKDPPGTAGDWSLIPGAWVDTPSSYSGPYRVSVLSFTRTTHRSESGLGSSVRVKLGLSWTPSFDIGRVFAENTLSVTSALDPSGNDVRWGKNRLDDLPAVQVDTEPLLHRSLVVTGRLQDFDLAKGLGTLEGAVQVDVRRVSELRVPLVAGTKVEAPLGSLVVQALTEVKRDGKSSLWVASLQFEPRKSTPLPTVRDAFDDQARFDGGERFYLGEVGDHERDFEAKTNDGDPRPKELILNARGASERMKIPFSFRNIVF
ncbi:MAG TPA: hypothetical protein VKW04_05645 [Planctomycetota bacterium]|nr:hypothetical protein [Planctomycetota bacterium]